MFLFIRPSLLEATHGNLSQIKHPYKAIENVHQPPIVVERIILTHIPYEIEIPSKNHKKFLIPTNF